PRSLATESEEHPPTARRSCLRQRRIQLCVVLWKGRCQQYLWSGSVSGKTNSAFPSTAPANNVVQLDTTLYAASINISRCDPSNDIQKIRLTCPRMYIHQGGPLALQSRTQLNHG